MKKLLLLFLTGYLLFSGNVYEAAGKTNDPADNKSQNGVINITSTPELNSLVLSWVDSYQHTTARQEFAVDSDTRDLKPGSVCFFTSDHPFVSHPGLTGRMVVGHEIIVPVMNAKNPFAEKLSREGVTADDLLQLITAADDSGIMKREAVNMPLKVYLANDKHLDSKLAAYCETDESLISAVRVSSAGALVASVQQDVNAIGFCRLADVLNQETNGFVQGIAIVPVDKNQNGKIDGYEDIFSSPQELTRGAWIGKYPRKLCGEVFAASASVPVDEAAAGFLTWIINEGQEPLNASGFSSPTSKERSEGMLVLMPPASAGGNGSVPVSPNRWMIAVAALAFTFILLISVRAGFKRKSRVHGEDLEITPAMSVDSIKAPAGLFYDKTHTWAFMEQDGLVKVGINDFLQHVTGRLTQVKLKSTGDKIRKGEKILTIIREGKQLEIYSPVTGTIKTQNKSLLNNPAQINSDPYSAGWVYQIEPSNWLRETKFMLMAVLFTDWLEEEFVRLKDFLAASANKNALVYNHIVLQDGGELTDNVLANLEPEVWEDFQTQFIDTSR